MHKILYILIYLFIFQSLNGQNILIPARLDDNWGYKNDKDSLIIEYKFQEAYPFYGTIARIKKDGFYGYINLNGKEIIKAIYTNAKDFGMYNQAEVELEGKKFCIDEKGNKIGIGKLGSTPRSLSCDYESYEKDGKFGVIHFTGDTIIEAIYSSIKLTYNTDIVIAENISGNFGIINLKTDLISEFIYDEITFEDKYIRTVKNEKIGAFDYNGILMAYPKYDNIRSYFSVFMTKLKDEKIGFIYKGKEFWEDN